MRRNKLQKLISNKHNVKELNKKKKNQKNIVLFQQIYEESCPEFNNSFRFF